MINKRDVYPDFRFYPVRDKYIGEFSEEVLNGEEKDYWSKSGLSGDTPISRLEQLNPRAIDLYSAPLKIAVCAQHNNGGLAGDIWWESTNIRLFSAVGEVYSTHGVSRPGGSALNSG